MKSTIRKRTFQAIYRLLDMVSPLPVDCGQLCGSICCTIGNTNQEMVIYLLPGEEKLFTGKEEWLKWGKDNAMDYDFPPSWTGKVHYIQCLTPPNCHRSMRPLQCRMFPIMPHYMEDDTLVLILNDVPLPYECPLIERKMRLTPGFLKASYTVWQRLLEDPLIHDMVQHDSSYRFDDELTLVYQPKRRSGD